MLRAAAIVSWAAIAGADDTLHKGQTLFAPTQLTAGSGNVRLQIQNDGNLVIVENAKDVLWASNSGSPQGPCHLFLSDNGNVAYYGCPNCGQVLWQTNTTGAIALVMQSGWEARVQQRRCRRS